MYSDFGSEYIFVAFVEIKTILFQNRNQQIKKQTKKKDVFLFLDTKLPLHLLKRWAFPYLAEKKVSAYKC